MATTAKPIDFLVSGVRDSSGVAVASGKVRWYSPGTLTPAVAYSDAACASPSTAPLTLNAAGQGTIYCLEPVRVIVKDSTESTTYYDDIAPLQRHDSVFITHPSFNSGAETTLENLLTTAATSFGTGFLYKESSGATARNYVDWMGELVVSVKDFGAVGDGTTDDTVAIQAAFDRVKARGGGWVFFPKGTYKITSAITSDTVGVNARGVGRVSIIKNFSTSANAFTIATGAVDSKMEFRDLAITANTTSSGTALSVATGNRFKATNVSTALHRNGILAGGTESQLLNCTVESGDDNASQLGLSVSTRGRIDNCNIISGTTNGTGLILGANARAVDCYLEKWGVGYSMTGAGSQARGCVDSLSSTGYILGAAGVVVEACLASGAGTGFSIGAFAGCGVPFSQASACTTDLTVNSAATLVDTRGAAFTGTVTNSGTSPAVLPLRMFYSLSTTASNAPTFTPDISGGKNINTLVLTDAITVALPVTIAAHATATLAIGDVMIIVLQKTGANNASITWNAQYKNPDATVAFSGGGTFSVTSANWRAMAFQWNGTNFVSVWVTPSTAL